MSQDARQLNNIKILLVEDNKVNQDVALMILEDIGYEADIAQNGQQCLDMLSSAATPYQLILMDCQMPVLDGYEATRKIRAGEAGKHYSSIPIISMTANALKGDEDKCRATGMTGYISKPIDEEKLVNLIKLHSPAN